MFHGRKKVDKTVQISEEELAGIRGKLEKIGRNNQILLQKRKDKEYTKETLMQTEKFSFLSPDFTTLWNYRREIMEHLFEQEELPGKLQMVADELKFLVKGIMKSPKSYTLWFQRQWTLEKGIAFEKQLPEIKMNSEILQNEIGLCNKMLKQDERNFHCWNYKLWVVESFLKEHTKRGLLKEKTEEQIYEEDQKLLVESECEMALGLIKKNFSNFSAWHYRSKLMPRLHSRNGLNYDHWDYIIPLDIIKSDFAQLKHAYFTDPKDQSPWNYHEWLIQQLCPVQLMSVEYKPISESEFALNLKLSHRVRRFDLADIEVRQIDSAGKEVLMDIEIGELNTR